MLSYFLPPSDEGGKQPCGSLSGNKEDKMDENKDTLDPTMLSNVPHFPKTIVL